MTLLSLNCTINHGHEATLLLSAISIAMPSAHPGGPKILGPKHSTRQTLAFRVPYSQKQCQKVASVKHNTTKPTTVPQDASK
jgi:hypothetical protein